MAHSLFSQLAGEYILETRVRRDIMQKTLAKELGISAQFLGRIEKGEVPIPNDILAKTIALLDLAPARLKRIFRKAQEDEFTALMSEVKRFSARL